MKIIFLSDTHTLHNEIVIEPCDIFCHSGDFTNRGSLPDCVSFFEWLRKVPAKNIIFIAGNHDVTLDKQLMLEGDAVMRMINLQYHNDVKRLISDLPKHIHYLHDSGIEIEGIKFWGSPVSPAFGRGWAFNKVRGEDIAKYWAKIPKDTNVLLTHTPPFDTLDYVEDRYKRFPDEEQRTGCQDLLNRIKFSLPKLKINSFGHIHGNVGLIHKNVSNKRTVCFINACLVNNRHEFVSKQPITIDYDLF